MSMLSKSIGIIGTGKSVPDNVVTNFDLEKIVDTSDAWIRERTGIEERRFAPEGVNASDLATEAGRQAIEAAGLTPSDIDLIIVATLTSDMPLPSTACLVQANLGAVNAAAYDLEAACSGFAYGIITASAMINAGMHKNVLVIGVEVLSRVLNMKDRNTCVLFGDGAGAAVVSEVEAGYGVLGIDMGADGRGGMSLCIPAGGTAMIANDRRIEEGLTFVHMDGKEVYKFAVKTMGKTVINALDDAGLTVEDIDFFVPHQANKRIIDSAAQKLNLPKEKVFVNLPKYGNTSAASIAIALDEVVRGGYIKRGDTVAFAGFGAGLTWAGIVMKWY